MTFTHKPGSKPLPRYEIQSGIGRGGFGEVYFAVSDAGKSCFKVSATKFGHRVPELPTA